jgi:hypothetical protein
MTKSSPAQAASRKQNVMDGRTGFRLRAEWGYVSVLEGGGHICELNLNACTGVNPLWRPPWATIDPFQTMPAARIRFSRKLTLDRVNPLIYCEEEAINLSPYDRPISWNEHVTFGPPFLEAGITWFDLPATRAKVCPASYSPRFSLQPGAEFTWPDAPTEERRRMNLRTTPALRFGHYTAQLLNPELEIAFIAACNPRLKLLVVYAFRRADFPWVGNWEERHNRTQAPWLGKTFCRGLEFSTTPFPIPRRDIIDEGPLFGEPTYRWLSAKSKAQVRFVILLFEVPEAFRGVARVSVGKRRINVVEPGVRGRMLSVAADKFL